MCYVTGVTVSHYAYQVGNEASGQYYGGVGSHKGKRFIAYLSTADLSRCNVFHLVLLEMLQNCSLLGFGTVDISSRESNISAKRKKRRNF